MMDSWDTHASKKYEKENMKHSKFYEDDIKKDIFKYTVHKLLLPSDTLREKKASWGWAVPSQVFFDI